MRHDMQELVRSDERRAMAARVMAKLDDLKEHDELQGEAGSLAVALLEQHLSVMFDEEEDDG